MKLLVFITLFLSLGGCSITKYKEPLHSHFEVIKYVEIKLNLDHKVNVSLYKLSDISYSYSTGNWSLIFVNKYNEFTEGALYVNVDRKKSIIKYKFEADL